MANGGVTVETYDVVIVGGGVMGSSLAFHLLSSDPTLRVAIVEKELKLGRTTFEVLRILSASLLDKTAIYELFKHDKNATYMENNYDLQMALNF